MQCRQKGMTGLSKAEKLTEILDACGGELFSALMSSGIERSAGIDRTVQLFEDLSDRIFLPRTAAAAYRAMAKRAAKLKWSPGEPSDRFSLTYSEHQRIEKKLREYVASGGRKGRVRRKIITAAAVFTAAAAGVFLVVRQVTSDEYLRRLAEFYIIINTEKSSGEEIVFSLQLREGQEPLFLTHLPTLILTDKSGETTLTGRELMLDGEEPDTRALCDTEYRELRITAEDYGLSFMPGHYKAVFELCSQADEEHTPIVSVTKELDV